jgi:glycerol-3-phosphate dehydrogenase
MRWLVALGYAGVAEGVATAPAAVKLVDKLGLRAPMIRAAAAVIANEINALEAVKMLLSYPAHSDLVVGETL